MTNGEITTAAELVASMQRAIPGDEAFRAAFESATVTTQYLARYYLQCLERTATGQPDAHLAEDNEQLGSLEHILPKSPATADWPNISREDAADYASRIGNLSLLGARDNSTRGNGGFDAAKPVYENCEAYQLTKSVADFSEWGTSQIEERQKTLAAYAVRAWPL